MTDPFAVQATQDMPAPAAATGLTPYYAGTVRMVGLKQLEAAERRQAEVTNNSPLIQGLSGHVRKAWSLARTAKQQTVEQRMLQNVRARRGEYDPEVLDMIRKHGGSEIYMMLTSNKCRAAASWLRDILLGVKEEKPWVCDPSPLPDLPMALQQSATNMAMREAQEYLAVTGIVPTPEDVAEFKGRLYDRIVANARESARAVARRMEDKMEDQLMEGGFQKALSQFIDDLMTFPSAFLKGPVVKKQPRLAYVQGPTGYEIAVEDTLTLTWERVDPFMMYPSPGATNIMDGDLIERHKLTRQQLSSLVGVEGYNEAAIKAVLDENGRGGLKEWLWIDAAKAAAEGKSISAVMSTEDGLIDALQFWGSVQGKLLVEWGMEEASVPDPLKDYDCEVWLIGNWVIKATINSDPLGRKPYYKASYEEIPGAFWGNCPADLCRDSQMQCNVAARAIANNMGIGSGPQVLVNVDRLPSGEDLTQMYPWKIWQTVSDPYGSSAAPVSFFQPGSIVGELIQSYTFFSNLADEHTGVPRYMTGESMAGGAGRTATGMGMLMGNASKSMKQVVANIDMSVMQPAIDRLYFYNMKYGEVDELKGDVTIRARGANYLVVKEQQQVRMNEFLQICLASPVVAGIVGEESIASILREGARSLDMDVDKLIPPPEVIRARKAQQQQMMMQQQMAMQGQPSEEIQFQRGQDGAVQGAKVIPRNNQNLASGAPVTDHFQPRRQA